MQGHAGWVEMALSRTLGDMGLSTVAVGKNAYQEHLDRDLIGF